MASANLRERQSFNFKTWDFWSAQVRMQIMQFALWNIMQSTASWRTFHFLIAAGKKIPPVQQEDLRICKFADFLCVSKICNEQKTTELWRDTKNRTVLYNLMNEFIFVWRTLIHWAKSVVKSNQKRTARFLKLDSSFNKPQGIKLCPLLFFLWTVAKQHTILPLPSN